MKFETAFFVIHQKPFTDALLSIIKMDCTLMWTTPEVFAAKKFFYCNDGKKRYYYCKIIALFNGDVLFTRNAVHCQM